VKTGALDFTLRYRFVQMTVSVFFGGPGTGKMAAYVEAHSLE
jgi:hypothetical protein